MRFTKADEAVATVELGGESCQAVGQQRRSCLLVHDVVTQCKEVTYFLRFQHRSAVGRNARGEVPQVNLCVRGGGNPLMLARILWCRLHLQRSLDQ